MKYFIMLTFFQPYIPALRDHIYHHVAQPYNIVRYRQIYKHFILQLIPRQVDLNDSVFISLILLRTLNPCGCFNRFVYCVG